MRAGQWHDQWQTTIVQFKECLEETGGDGGVEVTHSVYGHPHPCLELSIVKDSFASVLRAVGSIGVGQDSLHRSAFGYKLSTSQALLCLNLIWNVA